MLFRYDVLEDSGGDYLPDYALLPNLFGILHILPIFIYFFTSFLSSSLPLLSSSSTSHSLFYLSSLLLTSLNLTSPPLPSSHLLLFSPPGPVLASSAVRQGRYRHRYDRLREDLGLLDSSPVKNIQSGYVTVCTSCVLCMYTYVCVFLMWHNVV